MKSDIVHVTNGGVGVQDAFAQTEKVAEYRGLDKKSTLHLRLFAEEMMGMMQAITGEHEADFWLESDGSEVSLHLRAETMMNTELRKNLLAASTSGKNAAAKGVMGKIKDIFERFLEPVDNRPLPASVYVAGTTYMGTDMFATTGMCLWSLNQYKASIHEENAPQESWDELEKSIVSKLADEVKIAIADNTVEMIIYKKF